MNGPIDNAPRIIRHSRERSFADQLTARGIAWQYEPHRFPLPAPHNSYTPDFYIQAEDKYIELMGTRQAFSQARKKIAEFRKRYPEINLDVVKPGGQLYRCNIKQANASCRRCGYQWVPRVTTHRP